MYNPAIGRFLQTDPIGYADGINWYVYCGNNPVNWIDPWGLGKESRSAWGNFWRAGIMGDFAEDTGWVGVGTQVGVGLIPIAGQIADARDTVAAIRVVRRDPRKWGSWGQLGGAIIAWVPLFGDAGKGVFKGGRELVSEGAQAAAKSSDETFEIIDGVRRSKAHSMVGERTINAQILDSGGNTIAVRNVDIDQLKAPFHKQIINDRDRFMDTLDKTISGSKPPNIIITPGTKGIPIKDVELKRW